MTFYFYDLETSGFSPRSDRIMQFAGQRTDMDLNPIGDPDNILIKMTSDILPSPDAILVTGITPQQTQADGITEAEFAKYLNHQVFLPDTVIVGYNSIRFDDEFMRFLLWRNFYDAYEWQWKDGRSRWDLLDVARMTRALRPDGIKWPFAPDGKPTVRLEYMSSVNKLDHANAHDALSDVLVAIDLARLVKQKQPKLYDYLLNIRGKDKVGALVGKGEPFVYTSGRYSSEFEKTTVAVKVAEIENRGALVFDLRTDPEGFAKLKPAELAARWQARGEDVAYFPVKLLAYNKSPAVAPLSVLDDKSAKRLSIDKKEIERNLAKLGKSKDFGENLKAAQELMWPKKQAALAISEQEVDGLLYDGFVSGNDKTVMSMVRAADKEAVKNLNPEFKDERLKALFPLYKARNFPKSLSGSESKHWEEFRIRKVSASAEIYFKRIAELSQRTDLSANQKYLLEELNLYGQSVLPTV